MLFLHAVYGLYTEPEHKYPRMYYLPSFVYYCEFLSVILFSSFAEQQPVAEDLV